MASMYQEEISDFRKRLLEEIEESRKLYRGQCAQLRPTASTQCHTTNYNKATFEPEPAPVSASYQEPRRLTDEEIYYRSVSKQNQNLLQEKQKLIYTIQALQNEVRILREERNVLVAKENKGKAFRDAIADAKKLGKKWADKTIKWFNT